MQQTLAGRTILLVVGGGIAAYKALDLVRRLRERGAAVRAVLTKGGAQFVTPLSLAALTEHKVYQDLFSLTDEAEMGHIRLSREADLIAVVPATADLMAKMALGLADDLASTTLLASDAPVLVAPSMNVLMWQHPATQNHVQTLRARGAMVVGPSTGDLACGEGGDGRLADVMDLVAAIEAHPGRAIAPPQDLAGKHILVTSGPTHEPLDPVRYLGNRSSGKQGYAIAAALAARGARVTLVHGPVDLPAPPGVTAIPVMTAQEMLAASTVALPADAAVCAAAVADWRPETVASQKLKKGKGEPPTVVLLPNPDILATLAGKGANRPRLVVGFAAETEDLLTHARTKLHSKGCDWIIANDVSAGTDTFGGADNQVTLLAKDHQEVWERMDKTLVARRLAARIAEALCDA